MPKGCSYIATWGKSTAGTIFPFPFGLSKISPVVILPHEAKYMILHWQIRTGSDWRFSKILRFRTGADSIFADQDWTWIEKFVSPLISASCILPVTVTIVLQVFQSVPRNDRKVHYALAMHEWFTHWLFSWLRDTPVHWQIKLCCFRTTLNNPMHFGLAVVLFVIFQ